MCLTDTNAAITQHGMGALRIKAISPNRWAPRLFHPILCRYGAFRPRVCGEGWEVRMPAPLRYTFSMGFVQSQMMIL